MRYRAEFVPSHITTPSSERQSRHQFLHPSLALRDFAHSASLSSFPPSLSPLDSQGAFPPAAAAVWALPSTQSFGVPFMLGALAAAAVPTLKTGGKGMTNCILMYVLPGRIHSPKIAFLYPLYSWTHCQPPLASWLCAFPNGAGVKNVSLLLSELENLKCACYEVGFFGKVGWS